jgi:hypothetical protein
MSVVIKTKGQMIAPAVRLKSNVNPSMLMWAGFNPSVASPEKIFTPMISATIAFVRNIPLRMMKSLFFL